MLAVFSSPSYRSYGAAYFFGSLLDAANQTQRVLPASALDTDSVTADVNGVCVGVCACPCAFFRSASVTWGCFTLRC